MKQCQECKRNDAEFGMDCRVCHYVNIIMLIVNRYWREDELKSLCEKMRADSSDSLLKSCPEKAFLTRKLYSRFFEFHRQAGISPDMLKSKVCDSISRYLGDMEKVKAYQREKGEGSWMQLWGRSLTSILERTK